MNLRGAGKRIRTSDLLITNQLLYRLSYSGTEARIIEVPLLPYNLPMPRFTVPPPLALYVHIPWCVRKCPYCDFNSHQQRGDLPERAYVDALLADLQQDLVRLSRPARIDSIFFGGGTPSLFSAESIARLLRGIEAQVGIADQAEITLEANPGTVEAGRFAEFRAAGVNRLSIGVQSLNDRHLRALGRIHDRRAAIGAAEAAHAAGFDNFNLDLMYGLPQQTPTEALSDLDAAMALAPSHISHYELTLEPDTLFYKQPPPLPADDALGAMQQRCQERLAAGGYAQYEISGYARPGRRCLHNLNYWQFGDYLGIGAGAHGKLTDAGSNKVLRRWKCKNPRRFMDNAGTPGAIAGHQTMSDADLVLEFMLNVLRLNDGVPARLFSERTGLPLSATASGLQRARQRALLDGSSDMIMATALGRRFLNDLLELFMAED